MFVQIIIIILHQHNSRRLSRFCNHQQEYNFFYERATYLCKNIQRAYAVYINMISPRTYYTSNPRVVRTENNCITLFDTIRETRIRYYILYKFVTANGCTETKERKNQTVEKKKKKNTPPL